MGHYFNKSNLNALALLVVFTMTVGTRQICRAQQMSVSGGWSRTIDVMDLQGGAGSDLESTYISSAGQADCSVRKRGYWTWRVDVRKVDGHWDSRFRLDIRRSDNGRGRGTISGGTTFQEITDFDQSFFNGVRDRRFIGFQFRLRNVSVQIPIDTYRTTIVYTVVEL